MLIWDIVYKVTMQAVNTVCVCVSQFGGGSLKLDFFDII